MKAQGTELKDARIVFFGAGSSAVGVAKSISSVIELKGGLSAEEAKKVTYPGFPLQFPSAPPRQLSKVVLETSRGQHTSQSTSKSRHLINGRDANHATPAPARDMHMLEWIAAAQQDWPVFPGLQAIYLVDTKGLITNTRGDKLPDHKQFFSRTDGAPDMKVRPSPKLEGVTRV